MDPGERTQCFQGCIVETPVQQGRRQGGGGDFRAKSAFGADFFFFWDFATIQRIDTAPWRGGPATVCDGATAGKEGTCKFQDWRQPPSDPVLWAGGLDRPPKRKRKKKDERSKGWLGFFAVRSLCRNVVNAGILGSGNIFFYSV